MTSKLYVLCSFFLFFLLAFILYWTMTIQRDRKDRAEGRDDFIKGYTNKISEWNERIYCHDPVETKKGYKLAIYYNKHWSFISTLSNYYCRLSYAKIPLIAPQGIQFAKAGTKPTACWDTGSENTCETSLVTVCTCVQMCSSWVRCVPTSVWVGGPYVALFL